MPARRATAFLLVAALLAGCGGGEDDRAPATTIAVGRGATSAVVFRPAGDEARPPAVVFLHGWGAVMPEIYGAWIAHLVAQGNEVIFPRYQPAPRAGAARARAAAAAGVRAALRRAPVDERSLVFAGHSAGGALAADLAAGARAAGLPVPRAVFAAYPGRAVRGRPIGLGEVDPAAIPRTTRVVALAGADDRVVGDAAARRLARRAHGELVRVRDPAVDDHLGPQRDSPAARRIFWARLDALLAASRR